jgi:hypothetical protein
MAGMRDMFGVSQSLILVSSLERKKKKYKTKKTNEM